MDSQIVAVFCLCDDILKARYIKHLLSRSRFNRRLHRLSEIVWAVFHTLGEVWKALNEHSIYILDSFPVPVCDNHRIRRCHIYREEAYRGYQASKRRYYYGLKIHLLIIKGGLILLDACQF